MTRPRPAAALELSEAPAARSGLHPTRAALDALVLGDELSRDAAGTLCAAHVRGEPGHTVTVWHPATEPTEPLGFDDELRRIADLRHPAFIRAQRVTRIADRPAVVLEPLPGASLRAQMSRLGPVPAFEARRLVLPVLEALTELHDADLVHGRLAPDRVFVEEGPDGRPRLRLLCLGGADRLTSPPLPGSLEAPYAAPEQLTEHLFLERRTDVYAACVLLFELLTGEPLFDPSGRSVYGDTLFSPPRAPSALAPEVPTSLDRVILRGLLKHPSRRHAGIDRLARLLAACPLPFEPGA